MCYDQLAKHLHVSRETYDRLEHYVGLLSRWNQRINLIAEGQGEQIWPRHILDSLQLLQHLPAEQSLRIADLGSGAGLPGMVLAIATGQPVTLIESDRRKAAFLTQVKGELGLQEVAIRTERIEQCRVKADVITARALAPLTQLLAYSVPLAQKNTICLFLKGANWDKEVEAAAGEWVFSHEAMPSITSPEGRILIIKDIVNQ